MPQVVIIGGGLAGIACAVELSRAGLHPVLIEAGRELGGRAASWRDERTGDMVDVGPHLITSEHRNLLALFELLGTQHQLEWQSQPLPTLVEGARRERMRAWPFTPPLHMAPSLLASRSLSLRDKLSNLRASRFALRASEHDLQRLDAEPARGWLEAIGVSPHLIDRFWATIAMGVLATPLERCNAGALLRFYRRLLGYRRLRTGFAKASLGELYAASARDMIEAQGGRVLLGARAARLLREEEAVTGVVLEDGTPVAAELCVAAIPPRELDELYPGLVPVEAFEPSPSICCHLWFDRKLTHERAWSQPWSPETFNYEYQDLSNTRAQWQGRASVIATQIVHAHRAAGLEDDVIVERTRTELAELLPTARGARLQHARVHRLPLAIPCALPGTESQRPPVRSPRPGLIVCGDWTATGYPFSMESAVCSGRLAAEEVLGGEARGALAIRPRPLDGMSGFLSPH